VVRVRVSYALIAVTQLLCYSFGCSTVRHMVVLLDLYLDLLHIGRRGGYQPIYSTIYMTVIFVLQLHHHASNTSSSTQTTNYLI